MDWPVLIHIAEYNGTPACLCWKCIIPPPCACFVCVRKAREHMLCYRNALARTCKVLYEAIKTETIYSCGSCPTGLGDWKSSYTQSYASMPVNSVRTMLRRFTSVEARQAVIEAMAEPDLRIDLALGAGRLARAGGGRHARRRQRE